jgi:hypothetical protein
MLALLMIEALVIPDSVAARVTDAPAHPLAAGATLGSPTGLTGKLWLDRKSAVDLGLAFSFDSFFLVYADYLAHFPSGFAGRETPAFFRELTPYFGIGGVLFISTNSLRHDGRYFTAGGSSAGLGVRIPLGIEWRPVDPRLGVYVEIAPGVGVVPSTFGFLQGGLGIRFYF